MFIRQKGDHLIYSCPNARRPVIIPKYSEISVTIIRINMKTARFFRYLGICLFLRPTLFALRSAHNSAFPRIFAPFAVAFLRPLRLHFPFFCVLSKILRPLRLQFCVICVLRSHNSAFSANFCALCGCNFAPFAVAFSVFSLRSLRIFCALCGCISAALAVAFSVFLRS